ncbi:hypothetical protein [Niastella populi]|nr:hypothetical protein [Niastella populi]
MKRKIGYFLLKIAGRPYQVLSPAIVRASLEYQVCRLPAAVSR